MNDKVKKHNMLDNYWYIIKPALKERPHYFLMMAAKVLLFAAMPLMASWATSIVVTMLGNGSRFVFVLLAILSVFVVYGLVSAAYTYTSMGIRSAFIAIRMYFHVPFIDKKALDLPLERYERGSERQKIWKARAAVSNNTPGLEGMVRDFVTLGENLLGAVVCMMIVGGMNLQLMLLLLLLAVLSAAIWQLANGVYKKTEDRRAKNNRTKWYINTVVENIAAGKDIRVFGLSDWLAGKFAAAIRDNRRNNRKSFAAKSGAEIAEAVLAAARDLICYFYLIDQLASGMSVGTFVFSIGLVSGFAAWIAQIAQTYGHCRLDSDMVDTLRAYMEWEEGFRDEGAVPEDGFDSIEIEFDHVSYTYPDTEKPVLKDISFRLEKGGHLALVGLNGAGKSTLVKLMAGLYLPTGGRVLVNGVDTRELNRAKYASHEAAIFQNPFVLSYTIGENIALAEEWDEGEVLQAAKLAGLDEKLAKLPDGLHTYLGKDVSDSGMNLSGGEIQKLMLARVILRKASLVLLDEPTAALDALAEDQVYHSYNRTLADKTILFISHRLASTRFCDSILMLDNGRIAETGTHEELMEKDGIYAQLFRVQSKYYKEESKDAQLEE